MKKVFLSLSLLAATIWAPKKDYPIQPVTFTQVMLTGHFWLPYIKASHTALIPSGDTGIYKTIEGASYSLSLFTDKKPEAGIDSLLVKTGKAREPGSYLYTARPIAPTPLQKE